MWNIATLVNGEWAKIESFELPPQTPTTEMVRSFAREVLPKSHQQLVGHLDTESSVSDNTGTGNGRRDAIQIWSKDAVSEAQEFNWSGTGEIEALEESIALYPEGSETGQPNAMPDTLAWHDETAVVVPLTENIQPVFIEYTPSLRDENRVARLRHRYATAEHKLETIFDWRAYFGRESAIVDGWTTMRSRGHNFVGSFFGTFGFVVGHVVRRLTRPQPTLKNDPTARARLIRMTGSYAGVAASYPDLSRIQLSQADAVSVFVHGTISCGLQALKDLPVLAPDQLIFRYEHDTFHSVKENGTDLADLIVTKIRTKKLLLAAHSRGGLVARVAADELARRGYPSDIQVFTFGTPHLGTPLAEMGGQFLNLLYKLGGLALNAIPVTSPLEKAYSFLLDAPVLPPGIAIMREDSEELALLNMYGDSGRVSAWGGQFPINSNRSGFGIMTTGTLLGAMAGIGNDLVVPTHSALGFGIPQPVLSCSHTQYFQQPEVQAVIQNFYPVPLARQQRRAPSHRIRAATLSGTQGRVS